MGFWSRLFGKMPLDASHGATAFSPKAGLSYGGYQALPVPTPIGVLLTDNDCGHRRDAAMSFRPQAAAADAVRRLVPYLHSGYPWERGAAQAAMQWIRAAMSPDQAAGVTVEGDDIPVIEYLCLCELDVYTFPTSFCGKTNMVPLIPFDRFRCPDCGPDKLPALLRRSWAETPWNRKMQSVAEQRIDAESEAMAQQLVVLEEQMQRWHKDDTQRMRIREEIRSIGEDLGGHGGFLRMLLVCHRVKTLSGTYALVEMVWDGICGWQS